MASRTVKGLTVEIGGDTKKLGQALKDVESQSRRVSDELKDVQKLLKYDPSDVVGLTQKKELLAKAIHACSEKLEILRDAEKQVQDQFDKGKATEEQVRALSREIEATEIKMRDYSKSLDGTYTLLSKLGVETDDVKQATKQMADEVEAAKTPQQKLAESLTETDSKIKSLGKELSEVDRLLKDNGDNAELNAQRWQILMEAGQACADKVYYLEKAAAELQAQFDRGEISGDQLREGLRSIERQTVECENKMTQYKRELGIVTDEQDNLNVELEEAPESLDRMGVRLGELNDKYDNLTGQLKDVERGLKDSADNADLLTRKKELLAMAVSTAAERLEELENAQQKLEQRMRRGEDLSDEYEEMKTEVAKAKAELEKLDTELRQVNSRADGMDELGNKTKEAGDKAEQAKGGYTVLKDVLADICTDVLREFIELMKEAGKYILQTGMGFEQSMSEVEALLGPTEATAEAMAALTQLALDMGAKTKFSAGESAEAMTYLAQAGWDVNQIMAGLPGVMAMAATDGIDLATAAEICANALNSMGYQAADATMFADVLATVAAASCTNVEEMGLAFQYVGPVAGALGYEIDDLAVALGIMADAGIKGEKAGTSLRSLFTNLAKPTDAMAEAMEQYGISLTDAQGNMLPFSEVMGQLRTVFAGLTEEQQAALAATLAGKTGMAGLLSIVNASPEAFAEMTRAIDGSKGAAEEMAATMQDNLAGDVEKLGGAFETLSIKIFQKFTEPLREATQAVTGFLEGTVSLPELLESLGSAISGMAEGFKDFLPVLSEIGGQLLQFLIDGITNGLPGLLEKVNELVSSIGQYFTEMGPTFLQFGIDLLMNLAKGIADFIPNLITIGADIIGGLCSGVEMSTEDFISNALTILDNFADKLGEAIPKLIEKGAEFLLNMAKGISNALPEFIARAPEIISKFANLINDNLPTILMKGVQIIWELIKGIIKAIPDLIKAIPKIIKAIVDVWEAFNWLSLGKQAIDLLGKGIKAMGGWLKSAGKWCLDTIVNIIKNLPQTLFNLGKSAISFLGNGIRGCGSLIKDAAKFIWDTIVDFLLGLPDKLLSIGKDLVRGLWSGITSLGSWLWDKISNFGGTIIGWFEDLFGINSPSKKLAEIGMYLDQGLAKGIEDNVDDPMDEITTMANGIISGLESVLGTDIGPAGEELVHGLVAGIVSEDNWLYNKLDGWVGGVLDWVKGLFGIKSPSKVFAEYGAFLDQGLAKGILDNIDDPLNAATKMADSVIGAVDGFDGMSVESNIRHGEVRRAMDITTHSDNTMLGKLDKIVSAIERGQVLTIDGKALVGSTAQMYDAHLGQRRALVARGAV